MPKQPLCFRNVLLENCIRKPIYWYIPLLELSGHGLVLKILLSGLPYILIGKALLEMRGGSGERDSSGEELGGINMTVTNVAGVFWLALYHHFTLNTGIRRSTRLSWF